MDRIAEVLFPNVPKFGTVAQSELADEKGVGESLEPRSGIEPPTCRLRIGCSTS